MQNLARDVDKNDQIAVATIMRKINPIVATELIEAGISVFNTLDTKIGEVHTSLVGRLGAWEFTRGWVYWVARGRMPIIAARALQSANNGSIHCSGDCTAPAPDEQKTYIAPDGREIITAKDMKSIACYHAQWPSKRAWHPDVVACEYVEESAEFPRNDNTAYVTTYHIDTPEALKQFADFVKSLAT
jgi:hypothetical protein